VYLDPITVNSRKVLAGLDLLGTRYELKHVDCFTSAHKQPEYLNPNGGVPAVMDGDFALSESNAILQYAADLSGSDKHYPKGLKRRADTNRWLLWEASTGGEANPASSLPRSSRPRLARNSLRSDLLPAWQRWRTFPGTPVRSVRRPQPRPHEAPVVRLYSLGKPRWSEVPGPGASSTRSIAVTR
jgi:glutathione S-transferase